MPLCASTSSGFTSVATSGTSGSWRQTLESSMTIAPASRAIGAYSREAAPDAEMKTKSDPLNESCVVASTVICPSPKGIRLPAERSVARSLRLPMGKRRSAAILRNSSPTIPVAPTTATLYCLPCADMPLLLSGCYVMRA